MLYLPYHVTMLRIKHFKINRYFRPIIPNLSYSAQWSHWSLDSRRVNPTLISIDLYIYILDAVPPAHVVSNHVATDKLTTANGKTLTSSSASLGSQSR